MLSIQDIDDSILIHSLFKYLQIFELSTIVGKVNKRLKDCVERYAAFLLSKRFPPDDLKKLWNYQQEAIYGNLSSSSMLLNVIATPRIFIVGGAESPRRCDVFDFALGSDQMMSFRSFL